MSELDLRPKGSGDVRAGLHAFLHRSFSTDLAYLGAYRAWREAVLPDTELAHRQGQIEAWTTARVTAAITLWRQLPGARPGVNIPVFARLMDRFFWHLLGQAGRQPRHEFDAMVEATAHLLYHALFTDPPQKRAMT